MKNKLLLLILFASSFSLKAQIAFEDSSLTYNFPDGSLFPGLVRLRYAGDKYFSYDSTAIHLYNLNHTIYKNIPIPDSHIYGNYYGLHLMFISETLFDLDSTTIEYMLNVVERTGSISLYSHTHIYDEFGNVLFFKDSTATSYVTSSEQMDFVSQPVFNTDSGTKMVLREAFPPSLNYGKHQLMYSLPGTLYIPCDCITSSGNPLVVPENGASERCQMKNYPNPSGNKTTIEYKLPSGTHKAELRIVSLDGVLKKTYQITDVFSTIDLDNSDVPSGNYIYQILTPDGRSLAKKMMVIH